MEFKLVNDFEVKADGDGNTIVGYGSVYGNVDLGGDVVVTGAFNKSIASGRKVRMLWQHDHSTPIGVWNIVSEDEKGIKVEGVFAPTPKAQEIKELVKMGAIEGLSIGYKTINADYDSQGNRVIKEAELWEISVVTFPMNEAATITDIKAAEMTKVEFERFLRNAGLSRSESKAVVARGYEGLLEKNLRKADDISEKEEEVISEEETKFLGELKELLNKRITSLK